MYRHSVCGYSPEKLLREKVRTYVHNYTRVINIELKFNTVIIDIDLGCISTIKALLKLTALFFTLRRST